LNYLERRNGVILRYFSQFGYLPGVLRKSSRSLAYLLMSSCFYFFCHLTWLQHQGYDVSLRQVIMISSEKCNSDSTASEHDYLHHRHYE